MPVEIKELIIRASVVNNTEQNSETSSENISEVKEEIIAACPDQVLKIIERKQER